MVDRPGKDIYIRMTELKLKIYRILLKQLPRSKNTIQECREQREMSTKQE